MEKQLQYISYFFRLFIKVFIFLFILGFILYLIFLFILFEWKNGYYPSDVPVVRYCKTDNDCRPFASTCVNYSYKPDWENITSTHVPNNSFHNNFECECSDFLVAGFCSKK